LQTSFIQKHSLNNSGFFLLEDFMFNLLKKQTLFTILVILSLALFFAGCENLIGLGKMVNTDIPVISIPGEGENQPGSFLSGDENQIELSVEQPFGLDSVYMTIWYKCAESCDDCAGSKEHEKRITAEFIDPPGRWYINLDTSIMADGTIRAQVTAIDVDGQSSTTTDLIYTVKNTPPQLEMTVPQIVKNEFEDLHFSNSNPQAIPLIYSANSLMGIATDLYGIEQGYPQIMIWPVNDDGTLKDGITLDPDKDANGDDIKPSNAREWGTWRTVLDDKESPFNKDALKTIMFRWTTKKLIKDGNIWRTRNSSDGLINYPNDYFDVGRYHFKIRIKDKFGVTNVYPYRLDSGIPEGENHPNDYIAIYVAETSNPIISFQEAYRYYNASFDFTREIIINSKNGVEAGKVQALVSSSLSAHFNDEDKYSSYVTRTGGNENTGEYKIVIPSADILEISPSSNDNLMLHIRAEDMQGNFTVTSFGFILDISDPKIEFINPIGLENLPYMTQTDTKDGLTSTVRFMGTTSDPSTRVAKMYYALGRKEVSQANQSLKGHWEKGDDGAYSLFKPDNPAFNDGWTDTKLDTSSAANGHKGIRAVWHGSLNNWRWEFDNIRDVYSAGPTNVPDENGKLGNDYLDEGEEGWSSSNIWYLPISFKLIDIAGNVVIYTVKVIVDPDRDRPEVIINSHQTTTPLTVVGGEVRLNGTATDNEIIYDVQVRITAEKDEQIGVFSNEADWNVVTGGQLGTTQATDNVNYGFIPVTVVGSGSSVNWYFDMNCNNSANGGANTLGLSPPSGSNQVRKVKIEVRARDASIYSPTTAKEIHANHIVKTLYVEFSNTVPTITDIKIIEISSAPTVSTDLSGEINYSIGATVSKKFVIKAKLSDDKGFESVRIKGNETSEFTNNLLGITTPSGWNPWVTTDQIPGDDGAEHYIYIPLNTDDPANGLWNNRYYNKSGTYNLDIQVMDNTEPTPYIAQTTVALQIDNYYPGGSYNGLLNAEGTDYTISGHAWDTGDTDIGVFEVDKVAVYLSRPGGSTVAGVDIGTAINLNGTAQSTNASNWVNTQKVRINRVSTDSTKPNPANEGTEETLPFFPRLTEISPNSGTYNPNNAGIVINASKGTTGTSQSWNGVPNKEWSVQIDTTNLADGPLYINYVVFDKAGNASYFKNEVYVANNRPRISEIRLGTDINFDGDVTTTLPNEYYPYNEEPDSTAFRVRNKRFSLMFDINGGNGQKSSRVSHVRPQTNVTVAANTIKKGNVYTIEHMGEISVDEWKNMGVIGRTGSNYNGVTFVANNDYHGTNFGGLNPAVVTTYKYGGEINPSSDTWNGTGTNNTYINANNIGTGNTISNHRPNTFGNNNFGTSLIPDSVKGTDGIVSASKDRYFMIKVYDSTRSGAEENQLADVQIVRLDIDNDDSRIPEVTIDPFYWNSETDNSVYDADNELIYGHIELLNTPRQQISGTVNFRGTSFDSNNIKELYIRINNHVNGNTNTITQTNTYYRAATNNNGTWSFSDHMTNNGWKFYIESSDVNINGHTVKWRMEFNSRFINTTSNAATPSITNLNNTFSIIAIDSSVASSSPNGNRSAAKDYSFDVVPYITEVITPLSQAYRAKPSAFNRSALGWYPVNDSGGRIGIKGFNLNGANTVVNINGTNLSNVLAAVSTDDSHNTNTKEGIVSSAYTHITVPIGSAVISGALKVTVNGQDSINNTNNNSEQYNQEHNGLNNNLLTDDRNIYVWSVGSLLNKVLNGNDTTGITLEYPSFMVTETGRRLLAYNNLPTGNGRIALNNNVASITEPGTVIETTLNRYTNLVVTADTGAGSNPENWYIGGTSQTSNNITYYNLHARGATTQANANAGNQGTGINKTRILANRVNAGDANDSTRIRIPRVHSRNTGNNASMVVVSYGDSLIDQHVYLHYGPVSGAASSTLFSGDYVPALTSGNTAGNTTLGTTATIQRITDTGTQHQGSIYTASASLSTGVPVIAWYDRINQNLLISYGNVNAHGTSGTSTAAWQGRATVVQAGAGTHVDMAVDRADNVHLAYYDVFNGGLFYAYIPVSGFTSATSDSTLTKVSGITPVKVDTYLSAGTKIMINIREQGTGNYVPYISYLHSSFSDTKNSIRTAWPVIASTGVVKPHNSIANVLPGTDGNDRFTGNWEVMTVPVENVPLVDYFIANGVPRTSDNWVTPTGTGALSAAGFTNGNNSANINRTILVGYMTDNRYEGAVLKRDLWTPSP